MGSCADSTPDDPHVNEVHGGQGRLGLRRVAGYFRPHLLRIIFILFLMAAGAVLALVPALVLKELLDHLSERNSSFLFIVEVVVAGAAAAFIGGLVTFTQARLETGISQDIMFELRRQVYSSLLRQSVEFFTEHRAGDLMSRIGNDVLGIEDVVENTLSGIVSNAFILPATIVFMVLLDWRLTLMLPILAIPWIVASSRRVGQATFQARARTQQQHGLMTAYLNEVLGISGIILIKAFVRQGAEQLRFHSLNDELRRRASREAKVQRIVDLINDGLMAAAPAAFWLLGAYLVYRRETTVGTLVTFVVVLSGRLAMSVEDLASIRVRLAGSMALFERLFEIIDLPVAVKDAPAARRLARCQGAIAFENVTFMYATGRRMALDDVSFRVSPGQLVALVGPTGAGKSTVTYLLARFHDPQRGRVLIDGDDVREISLDSLGRHIGIVFQDTFLFHASIRDNLLYANQSASSDQIIAAAKAAYLHEFIESLPDGYETLVGERGHALSGGEKQRVAIARIILRDPEILILDEATSHLDTVSERLVQGALDALFRGRTSIVIAHRLSTILAADQILVLNQGRLVEQGTHDELTGMGGLYSRLFREQFGAVGPQGLRGAHQAKHVGH